MTDSLQGLTAEVLQSGLRQVLTLSCRLCRKHPSCSHQKLLIAVLGHLRLPGIAVPAARLSGAGTIVPCQNTW